MKRFNRPVVVFILLTCMGLVLRKLMIPGASSLLTLTLSSLTVLFFILSFRSFAFKDGSNSTPLFALAYFAFSLSSIAFLFRIHYWDGTELFLWPAFTGLIVLTLLLIYYFFFQHTTPGTEKRIYKELLLPFLFFLFVIPVSVIANQRQFHNFFRGSLYESYIRKTYPDQEAQLLLEKNQCTDSSCIKEAEKYFLEGMKNDSLKLWEEAFHCYNKAIDYNIHFADAYCHRATNRMLRTLIDEDVIKYALLDCNIAIRLKPEFASAYLRRAFIYSHTKQRNKACVDFVKAKALDNSLKVDWYIKNSCGNAVKIKV